MLEVLLIICAVVTYSGVDDGEVSVFPGKEIPFSLQLTPNRISRFCTGIGSGVRITHFFLLLFQAALSPKWNPMPEALLRGVVIPRT